MKKNEIKMSIIVPVYNVESYLRECLTSLVNQSLDNYEILVINDGSPDNSQVIIDEFVERYPGIVKGYIKENGGLSDARNYGVSKAIGEYIGFVDSDDYVDVHMFEDMYNKAKETSADIVAVPFSYVYDNKIKRCFFTNVDFFGKSVSDEPGILQVVSSPACNKIYNLNMWNENKFKFPKGVLFEDSNLIYNVLLKANKIECVNKPMYYYRQNNVNSITNNFNSRISDIFLSCDSVMNFYKEHSDYERLYESVRNICVRHIMARINLAIKYKDKSANDFIDKAYNYLNTNFSDWRKDKFFYPVTPKIKKKRYLRKHKNLLKFYSHSPKILKKIVKTTLFFPKTVKVNIKKKFQKRHSVLDISQKEADQRRKFLARNGYEVITKLQAVLDSMQVTNFADFGTLLGFVRENGFMSHDLDIDVGAISDIDPKEICTALEAHGFKLWREFYFNDMIIEQSYKFKAVKIDLNFYKVDNDKMYTYLFYTKPGEKNTTNSRSVVKMSYDYIRKTKKLNVEGYKINVPIDAEKLLVEKYGNEWKIPNSNWIYWKSPAAMPVEGQGNFVTYVYSGSLAKTIQEREAKEKLKELQKIEMIILKEVDKICKENKITYYLGEGSLLGAVRHKGFIPWDDDIDLLMPRKDYEKFLKIAPTVISTNYEIQHSSLIKNYWSPFIKVRYLKNSSFKQQHIAHLTENNGPLIDIFPLDTVPKLDSFRQKIQAMTIKLYRGMLSYKLGTRHPKKYKGYIVKFASKFVSVRKIHKKLDNTFIKYNNSKNKYIVNLASYYNYRKQTVPKNWYGQPRMVKFENMTVPIPKEAEKILSSIYGDYMILPPKDKQVIKHHF